MPRVVTAVRQTGRAGFAVGLRCERLPGAMTGVVRADADEWGSAAGLAANGSTQQSCQFNKQDAGLDSDP